MKRLILPFVLATLTIACSDEPSKHPAATTAPGRPRLTASNLPADASTVCVSAVKQRDQLATVLSNLTGGEKEQKLAALDALVEDTCY
jgi:hypothetical protein